MGEARLRHRQLANSKRGELVEIVETLKDFRVNFKNGFLSSSDDESDDFNPSRPRVPVLSEADALQKIAQLQIKSNYLESSRKAARSLSTRDKNTPRPSLSSRSTRTVKTSQSFNMADTKRDGLKIVLKQY